MCDRTLIIEDKEPEEIVAELKSAGFKPDPVKSWKASQVTIYFDLHCRLFLFPTVHNMNQVCVCSIFFLDIDWEIIKIIDLLYIVVKIYQYSMSRLLRCQAQNSIKKSW